ncbi:uncharacterized protein LOC121513011 isoform X2 [Cheilinus undulatus]|uniref:uncharacterized protein LOC121513011 isoform X2 n=1 Tax=Cheilinus undulatus TaxID=241271 RepID=UPI001BD671AF|nr:uncharacterized protein LOC121513011 isoform X2 [Cheilinus undulatus]
MEEFYRHIGSAGFYSSSGVDSMRDRGASQLTLDLQQPSLKQREEELESLAVQLLETLVLLSEEEFRKFFWFLHNICHHRHHSDNSWMWQEMTNRQDMVFFMLLMYGKLTLGMTKEALTEIKRTDLVQRLSDMVLRTTGQHYADEHLSAIIHKVSMMMAVKELLLESLCKLSCEELNKFRWLLPFTVFQWGLPSISWGPLQEADTAHSLGDLMVETFGRQAVELVKEVYMDMERTDLVLMLFEVSSGPKEEQFMAENVSGLIQEVKTMENVIKLLLETLEDLSDQELKYFNKFLDNQINFNTPYQDIPWLLLETTDCQNTVFLMVLTYNQQSLKTATEILKNMKRRDLMQRMSNTGSGLKKEQHSALIHKVATMVAANQLLLKILHCLNDLELEKFMEFLQLIVSQKDLADISYMCSYTEDKAKMVDLMVRTYGSRSVELTRDVLMKMKRTDLMQMLSDTCSVTKEKESMDDLQPKQSKKEPTKSATKQVLLKTLEDLSYSKLEKFKWMLQVAYFHKSLPQIPWSQMKHAKKPHVLVDLLVRKQQSVEVAKEVLKDIQRSDLVERLSGSSSKHKDLMRSLEFWGQGSIMHDSSVWNKLEPQVQITDTEETPTYSLQSKAVNCFECSVSGLRWVCKDKVSFQYQFCSWGGHMERMESMEYLPAGPLMDIRVAAGKFDEVYLPHWICTDGDSNITKEFAVLHIDDCGDFVEKVSAVTPSHVKLSEPVFTTRGVLMKVGFPVKISCNVLIYYKPNTPFLKLHVYLIPCDPALKKTVDTKELSNGYEIIQKPRPDNHLKMLQGFSLTADIDSARIFPEKVTLRYDSQDPNFYEVFIENPDRSFHLTLSQTTKVETQCKPVWTCEIRNDDYQNPTSEDKHLVDLQLSSLLQKAATITTDREILLKTLEELNQEDFEKFKWFLQDKGVLAGLPCISTGELENKNRLELVDLMLRIYSQQCTDLTKEVLRRINRNDLVQML